MVKIENVVHFSQTDESSSYNYIALNEQYWQEKAYESEVVHADFTSQYLLLNRKVKSNYSTFINRFISFKPLLLQRFVFNVIYVDEDFS